MTWRTLWTALPRARLGVFEAGQAGGASAPRIRFACTTITSTRGDGDIRTGTKTVIGTSATSECAEGVSI